MRSFFVDNLEVIIESTSDEMGKVAALAIAEEMKKVAKKKDVIRMMFAAAPSQNTTLSALLQITDLPWDKVIAFHMDEYIGISQKKPQSFRNYLDKHIFSCKPFKEVNLIQGDSQNTETEVIRYGKLLKEPLDIIVLGIGENGHIAFNDPPYADFSDPNPTKIVRLSQRSRVQQVNDKCFSRLEDVPSSAITVTIPVFMKANALFCVVPNIRKAEAIKKTLEGPVDVSCPATILRKIENTHLFIDSESASLLTKTFATSYTI